MPLADVGVCNIALSRIVGCNLIQSLTDQTREAELCAVHLPLARDAILEEIDWPWARRQKPLVLLNETITGHTYVYRKPVDCIRERRIYNPAGDETTNNPLTQQTVGIPFAAGQAIPYSIGLSDTGNFSTILTEMVNAELIYTAAITNIGIFPPKVCDALAWRLAAELAVPLKGDYNLAAGFTKDYLAALTSAEMRSANSETPTPTSFSNYANARQ